MRTMASRSLTEMYASLGSHTPLSYSATHIHSGQGIAAREHCERINLGILKSSVHSEGKEGRERKKQKIHPGRCPVGGGPLHITFWYSLGCTCPTDGGGPTSTFFQNGNTWGPISGALFTHPCELGHPKGGREGGMLTSCSRKAWGHLPEGDSHTRCTQGNMRSGKPVGVWAAERRMRKGKFSFKILWLGKRTRWISRA